MEGQMKLTTKSTAGLTLPAGKSDVIYFDEVIGGFGLRLRSGGSATWIFQYSLGRSTRRIVIGKAAVITADKAREHAADLHAKVRLGGDPAADKRTARAKAAETLGAVADSYLDHQQKELRPSSFKGICYHLRKRAAPLRGMPIGAIDRGTVAAWLANIAKSTGPANTNRARSTLSAMFVWAMKEGRAEHNPVVNTNVRTETPRDRILTDSEIAAIWGALGEDVHSTVVKLLLLTGQRKSEIADLKWDEIDFVKGIISLPGERTKNGKPHEVPMSGAVSDLLESQPKISDWVFGRPDGRRLAYNWTEAKERIDARITVATGKALPHWVFHDLRRTCATRMADLGVLPHVVESVLNHVSGHKAGVAGIYNRSSYLPEKAQALALWADHITAIVDGRSSNVLPLKRA
jgi:integrase